jgi:hypothetical protein
VNTNPYHHAWAQLVSALPGVNYVKKENYEINAGLKNVLKVFNNLLFGNSSEFDQKTTEEKLNQITTVLSRDGFTLSWNIIKGKLEDNVDIALKFEVKGSSNFIFEWQFMSRHFVIRPIVSDSSLMQSQIAQQLINADMPNFYLLGWYKNVDLLKNIIDLQKLKLAIYMQNLTKSEVARKVVLILLEKKIRDESLIINLCKSLPSDPYLFEAIIKALPEEQQHKNFVDSFVSQLMIDKPILSLIVKVKKKNFMNILRKIILTGFLRMILAL